MPNMTEELELPPLDGEGSDESPEDGDEEIAVPDDADPYDDADGNADPIDEAVDEQHDSILGDDAVGLAAGLDEPVDDIEGVSLLGDDDSPGTAGEDFDIQEGADALRDGGEEGFLEPEPELRAEDLPRLDGDEDDDDGFTAEEAGLVAHVDLRWDDRAFERLATHPIGHVLRLRVHAGLVVTLEDGSVKRSVDGATFIAADAETEDDDEAALLVRGRARALLREGVGVLRAIDDGPLTLVEATAGATAFTLLDEGSLLVALEGPERCRLVRIGTDGAATVVADEESTIEALAIDPRTGLVWAGGVFGVASYRAR